LLADLRFKRSPTDYLSLTNLFLAAISRNIQASPLFNTETGLKTKKAAFNKESSFFLFI
jgi:hypothetical protein